MPIQGPDPQGEEKSSFIVHESFQFFCVKRWVRECHSTGKKCSAANENELSKRR